MAFKIKERSSISMTGVNGYSSSHKEITDAIETAVNHLTEYLPGSKAIISHSIEIERQNKSEIFMYKTSFLLSFINLQNVIT